MCYVSQLHFFPSSAANSNTTVIQPHTVKADADKQVEEEELCIQEVNASKWAFFISILDVSPITHMLSGLIS